LIKVTKCQPCTNDYIHLHTKVSVYQDNLLIFSSQICRSESVKVCHKYNSSNDMSTKFNTMNKLRNRVQLIGHLGMNPDVKTLESGTKLAKFSLATNDSYVNTKGEKVEETEWHNVIAWNKTAELVESYLEKGKEVALEGKLTTRSWDDENGNKKYITEVVCSEILFLGKGN